MNAPPAKLRAALDAIDSLESALEALEPYDVWTNPNTYRFDLHLNAIQNQLQRLEQQALNPGQP